MISGENAPACLNMKGDVKTRKALAFSLVELLLVVVVLAVLAVVLLRPMKGWRHAGNTACINNLAQVGRAFALWSIEHADQYPMSVPSTNGGTMEFTAEGNAWRHFQPIADYAGDLRVKVLICPSDNRKPATGWADLGNTNLSYFIGLDANRRRPQMLLTGDPNITNGLTPLHTVLNLVPDQPAGYAGRLHGLMGNLGLADGSVQGFSTLSLRRWLASTGDLTNRIALPE